MTRGEAVNWLRKYKREIPKYNFRRSNPMKDPEFLWSSRAMFAADELIFRIQNEDRDPLDVVEEWCMIMGRTLFNADIDHEITIKYASMMEVIGRDILRCMRAADKNLVCRTQLRRRINENKGNH